LRSGYAGAGRRDEGPPERPCDAVVGQELRLLPKNLHSMRGTNNLNDLSGKEWVKLTRTWFVCDSPRYYRNKPTELPPARFPEEMAAAFPGFFTQEGGSG